MAKNHVWRIKKPYFLQLKSGDKDLEIRVGYTQIKKVHAGDTITFENYGDNLFDVKRVSVYDSFEELLAAESVECVLPGMTYEGALRTLHEIYPPDKERLGVYAFNLKYHNKDEKIFYHASSLLKQEQNRLFAKLVAESYMITDWICEDYPNHCDHFYSKYVPGIFDGEREIISCYIGRKIVATAFLKKISDECKISTFFVAPRQRQQGIATELLKQCFAFLGTTKPLITISDYKLPQFEKIIAKYDWKQTQILGQGHYNDHSREYVFNGRIS